MLVLLRQSWQRANEFSLTQERNATIKVMKTRAGTILENNRWKVDKAREQDRT